MLSIGKYIRQSLTGVTTQINPLLEPDNTAKPFIVYKRLNETPNEYTRDGDYDFNTTSVQIDCVCTNYEDSLDMVEKVRQIFEGKSGSYKGVEITTATLRSADESTDGNLFIQTVIFDFITN